MNGDNINILNSNELMEKIALILIGLFFLPVFGQSADIQVTEEKNLAQDFQDQEIIDRAKNRIYRGGAEEGELRIQAQLPQTLRKINPIVEKDEMEKESQDHD